MPRIWLLYFNIFTHPLCPAPIQCTHARRTFDRALRTLPPSLHARMWPRYLIWAELKSGMTTVVIYRRYLRVDPSLTEHYVRILLNEAPFTDDENVDSKPVVVPPPRSKPRPLEAAKLLLTLARKASRGEYISPEGKSPYQLLLAWLEVAERYADEIGLEPALAEKRRAERAKREEQEQRLKEEVQNPKDEERASVEGNLIRFAGPPVRVKSGTGENATVEKPYDEDEDPASDVPLDVEGIVKQDGLDVYKDQAGRIWSGLATYWTKRGEFDRVSPFYVVHVRNTLNHVSRLSIGQGNIRRRP
jgi:pre-mRNA-splicing factor SYF1